MIMLALASREACANEYVAMIDEYPRPVVEEPEFPEYEFIVNRSTYTMDVFANGQLINTHRVIVGRPGRTTPVLETQVKSIELNPTWDVPKSLTDDMVRKFKSQENPLDYIRRMQYYFVDKDGNEIPANAFDWSTMPNNGPYDFKIKQKPGPLNMLGQVMFVLEGTGGIQMHGTSTPNLFEHEQRRFSSGCIRVDGANDVAAMVLGKDLEEFHQYRTDLGSGKWIKLPVPIKVKVVE